MSTIEGGCLCGAIRYSSGAAPLMTAVCSCKNCQRQTGTSFSVLLAMPKGSIQYEGASLATYEDTGSSGQPVLRQFCPKCGSPIMSTLAVTPTLEWLKAGTLDDAAWVKPTVAVWCQSAQPWVDLGRDVTQFAQNPPRGA